MTEQQTRCLPHRIAKRRFRQAVLGPSDLQRLREGSGLAGLQGPVSSEFCVARPAKL